MTYRKLYYYFVNVVIIFRYSSEKKHAKSSQVAVQLVQHN